MKKESLHHAILRAAVVLTAAAFMLGSCGDDVPAETPVREFYDGPLAVRAQVDGTLETRTTHPAGELTSGEWYLSCPIGSTAGRTLRAKFNSAGYAELSYQKGDPVELTWNNLIYQGWPEYGYHFVLDNVPHFPADRSFDIWLRESKDSGSQQVAHAVKFKEDEIRKYSAGLETEDGKTNDNDIIQGYTTLTEADRGNKVYVDLTLKHLMARVHVELTSSTNTADLTRPVKVWIDHLASESYALNRSRAGSMENNTLIIRPVSDSYIEDVEDGTLYNHTFYLIGSKDEGKALLPVTDEEDNSVEIPAYRTGRLILPPQDTHMFDRTLAPKIHVELDDGRTYTSDLPGTILPDGSGAAIFSEFRSGWDITLKGDITDKPPHIQFTALVQEWNGRGRFVLDTNQGGVVNEEDYKTAVSLLNLYGGEKATGKSDDDLEKLKHRLERYGHWDDVGMFIFDFFGNIEGEIRDDNFVKKDFRVLFGVDLHGHEVYGCKSTHEKSEAVAARELKNKMVNETALVGVSDDQTLREALKAFESYVNEVTSLSEEERMKTRGSLEKYGYWEIQPSFWILHIDIMTDIPLDAGKDILKLTCNSYGKNYLKLELNSHTVWGYTDGNTLRDQLW